MTKAADAAVDIFLQNFNCSQAVFSTLSARYGVDEKLALKMASPFGGGVARRGELCGAVTGALMVLGLARGAETPAGKDEIYRLSQEFMHRFEEKHASILCRHLLGCDLATPEGAKAAAERGVFRSICPGLVRDAVEIVEEQLNGA